MGVSIQQKLFLFWHYIKFQVKHLRGSLTVYRYFNKLFF